MELTSLYLIIACLTFFCVGCFAYFFSKLKTTQANAAQKLALLDQKSLMLQEEIQKLNNERDIWNKEQVNLNKELIQADTNLANLEEKFATQANELEQLQNKFQRDFELIANKIVKENASEISKSHQKELNQLLQPLQEKIRHFESNIEKKYIDELKERTNLKSELGKLLEVNNTLNQQARDLTTALKGDNKAQGNWGEMVLERILENSGLIKGSEYKTQVSDLNSENRKIQPDVIIQLPDHKHLIIDSKVSLVHYERYISEKNSLDREKHIQNHLFSVRNHIKGLSEKNYQTASKTQCPDFVLLFMPIEAAFSLALQQDSGLFQFAWEKKVVLVCPTTLLASLRTISSVWKNERQTKNAQDIAEKAGNLYDKFVGFIKDMESIDKSLKDAQNHYNSAFGKLTSGRGNLVKRAETLKELGAKANKSLPNNLLEND